MGKGVLIALVLLWSLGPIYWALNSSLMQPVDLTAVPPHAFPPAPTLKTYSGLLGLQGAADNATGASIWPHFRAATINSLVTAVAGTLGTIVVAALGGYAFARLRFPGRNIVFGLVVATLAVPGYTVIIPLYRLMIKLGLVDTYLGLTLIYMSAFLPLALWLMRSFFLSLPKSLEEAAQIDGASRLYTLFRIVLPLAMPGLIATAIVTFLSVWQQFSVPLVFSPTYATKPLTVMIPELASRHDLNFGLINAAGILAILPPFVVVVFLNRFLVQGLTAGAGK
ncbi:carbohydrate ABC transporter permease [Faunimonas pinastri]|uniref:carbohydrate ABC transporter permease n=1 Tax=Faunimonas pinastri TaxID=1855383 RepID=UPI003D163763